jgi:hypothetical protein
MDTTNAVPRAIEDEETVPVEDETMAELVYGRLCDDEIPCAPFGAGGGGLW